MKANNLKMGREMEPTDEALASAGQQVARSAVKMLTDDTLSMTWRSSLNERLVLEAAARKRRQRIAWVLRPAMGLGLAFSLAVLVMFRSPRSAAPGSATATNGGLEAALVSTHRQSTYAWEVAGVGLSPTDFDIDPDSDQSPVSPSPTNWNDDDLDSL